METDQLVIERSAPVTPDDAERATWLADQHVFISSVITGMEDVRRVVADAIGATGARAVWFEQFGGRDDDPEAAYLSEVGRCTIYVGILGERYGKPARSGYSATHAEYDEAQRRGLRASMWVSSGEHDGRQSDFIDEVGVFQTYGTYSEPGELGSKVAQRLGVLAAEGLSPWVKLGPVVFRANTIRESGKRIDVVATTRDNDVMAALQRLRDPRNRSHEGLQFTYDLTSTPVDVIEISSETTAARTRKVELNLARRDRSTSAGLIDVAYENRSPEELTELALRVALFGAENPLGRMGFMAQIPNPFESIVPHNLSEEVIGGVALVLLSESLIGSGRAERITDFRLGPSHRGRRRLSMSWLPRKRYINVPPEERHIEGDVEA